MGSLMFLIPQGQNLHKLIQSLEKRVQDLEILVKELKSEPKPKIGRPPKVKDEPVQDMRSL